MMYIENAVTIEEIAAVTKRKAADVEAEARELGIFLGTDWAGRPCMAEQDAYGLVSGSTRAVLADEAEWKGHLDECAGWTCRRDELVREAQRAAELAAQRAGRGGGHAATAGVEAGRAAGADYEAANPPPLWNGAECGNARLLYCDGKRGLLDKARDLLAGSPR